MNPIEVRNLTKVFKNGKYVIKALDSVSLNVKKGEIYGLLGPNGAGKTTLAYILSGLLLSDKGSAKILGMDVGKESKKLKEKFNVCFGDSWFFSSFSPRKILRYYSFTYNIPRFKAEKRIEELAEILKFKHFIDREYENMSRGMRQKIAIARSLLNEPEVLLLDEPTVGLDVDIATEVRGLFKELANEGMTILLTSHYMQEVETLCKRITLVNNGRAIKEGNIAEIKKKIKIPDSIFVVLDNYEKLDFIKKVRGVTGYDISDERLKIFVKNGKDSIEPLLNAFKKRKRAIRDLEIRNTTLEEAFIKLVGK